MPIQPQSFDTVCVFVLQSGAGVGGCGLGVGTGGVGGGVGGGGVGGPGVLPLTWTSAQLTQIWGEPSQSQRQESFTGEGGRKKFLGGGDGVSARR